MKGKLKLLGVIVVLAFTVYAAEFNFTNLDYYTEESQTHIILEADSTFFYTSYRPDDTTLVIEVPGAELGGLPAEKALETSEVTSISSEQTSPDRAKFTFELKPGVDYELWMHGQNLYLDFNSGGTVGEPWESVPAREPAEPLLAEENTETSEPVLAKKKPELKPVGEMKKAKKEKIAPEPVSVDPADFLLGVRLSESGNSVYIDGDGAMDYYDFVLEDPRRIVLDISGVVNTMGTTAVTASGNPYLERVRVAQFRTEPDNVSRVVFDMSGDARYTVMDRAEGLEVVFGDGVAAPAPMEVAEAAEVTEPEPAAPPVVEIEPETAFEPVAEARLEPEPVTEQKEQKISKADFEDLGMGDIDEDVTLFEAADTTSEKPAPKSVTQDFTAKTIQTEEAQYTGKPISIDFKDADLKEVFRFFSELSGLNFVLDKSVGGKITIILRDVPWDQALDIVLKNEGLGKVYENNVLRIAPVSKLAQEEASQRKLEEERELSVPPITITKTISYAKAKDIEKLLGSVMSKRGEVVIDERTNTMIINDIPDKKEAIINLIEALDRPTPQVEIEARIVETSKDFAREFGIQWGGQIYADQAHGTTTNAEFPHSVVGDFYVIPPPASSYGGFNFLFGNVLDSFLLDVSLAAMERDGKGKILSAPKITTQNNVQATIESGTQIPIVTTTATDIKVEFKSASLKLDVKPQITADQTVIMTLRVDKSQPDFAASVGGVPSITTRNAETTVLVDNGGTAVIGGIFQLTTTKSDDYVPVLGKLPGLGWLFKRRTRTVRNDELLIFVTPRILE